MMCGACNVKFIQLIWLQGKAHIIKRHSGIIARIPFS